MTLLKTFELSSSQLRIRRILQGLKDNKKISPGNKVLINGAGTDVLVEAPP